MQPSPGPMAKSTSLREMSTGVWISCWGLTEDTRWARGSAGCDARGKPAGGGMYQEVHGRGAGSTPKALTTRQPQQQWLIVKFSFEDIFVFLWLRELCKLLYDLREKLRNCVSLKTYVLDYVWYNMMGVRTSRSMFLPNLASFKCFFSALKQ